MGCLVPHFSATGGGRGELSLSLDLFSWQERQRRTEEGNILGLQERRDEDRRKIREEKARLARRAAIQVGTGPGRRACPWPLGCPAPGGSGSSGRQWQGRSASLGAFHEEEFERALETECSPWRRRCHRAVCLCAPAKAWQLLRSWFQASSRGKGDWELGNCSSSARPGTGLVPGGDRAQVPAGWLRAPLCPRAVPPGGTSPPLPRCCSSLGQDGCSWGQAEGLGLWWRTGSCVLACNVVERVFKSPSFSLAQMESCFSGGAGGRHGTEQLEEGGETLQQPRKRACPWSDFPELSQGSPHPGHGGVPPLYGAWPSSCEP